MSSVPFPSVLGPIALMLALSLLTACREAPPTPAAAPAVATTPERREVSQPSVAADGNRNATERAVAPPLSAPEAPAPSAPRRNLARDEARGGHTIARHVGRTDAQLRERLRAEPSLTVASTYTDLTTAETTVEQAFRASSGEIRNWTARRGRRPNLAVNYTAPAPVGRSLRRNASAASECASVVVVLRWDERREDSYVLTSYPDCRR